MDLSISITRKVDFLCVLAHIRPMTRLSFTKMNGCKNEFVLFDARTQRVNLNPEDVRTIANKTHGYAADQVIVFSSSTEPLIDAHMTIYNADGSQAEACGNATRCVAHLLNPDHAAKQLILRTAGGLLECTFPSAELITVDMGRPKWNWDEIPLRKVSDTLNLDLNVQGLPPASAVNMGNPHLVFFVKSLQELDVETLGRDLEVHPLFPMKTNVSFAEIVKQNEINLTVWERGVGQTQACGSAACATAVVAHRKGLTGSAIRVHQPGGMLTIEILPDQHVLMTGPVEVEFTGEIELEGTL